MPNDTAITRLLYAMLSQKCLKDIDWNLVARDPILSQEITNGHAARMRYSRFKKQMEGTSATARKPRKNKVAKSSTSSSSSKVKPRKHSEPDLDAERERVKPERNDAYYGMGGAGDSFNSTSTSSAREMQTPDPESEMGMSMNMHSAPRSIKKEHGISMSANGSYQATTPMTSFSTPNYGRYLQELSASPSPNTSFNHMAPNSHTHGHGNHEDEMFASFGSSGGRGAGMPALSMGLNPPNLMFGEVHGGVHGGVHGVESTHHSQLAYDEYGALMSESGPHLGYDGMWQQENPDHELERSFEIPGSDRGKEEEGVNVKSERRWS